jgi:hypothetical protein
MRYQIDETVKRRARWAHELFLINVLFFHLLLTPASIALEIGWYGLLLPLLFSSGVILFTWYRGRMPAPWFVVAHWRLAFRRCRLLLLGYAITALVFLVAWLVTLGIDEESMKTIMLTVFTRIAVMPTLIMVMVTAVIEAGGINQVGQGEVPDWLVERLPKADVPLAQS